MYNFNIIILCLLLFTLSFHFFAAEAPCRTVHVAATSWAPYMMPGEPDEGPLLSIARKAMQRAGYELKITPYPWARAVKNVKDGKLEVLASVTYLPEREQFLFFSDVVLAHDIHLIHIGESKPPYSDFEDLCPAVVGGLRGGLVTKVFAGTPCIEVVEVNDIADGLKMLSVGRMDYFFQDTRVLRRWAFGHKSRLEHFAIMEPPAYTSHIHFGFSRAVQGSDLLRDAFNAALRSMKADGTFEEELAELERTEGLW